MQRGEASINDTRIAESDRRIMGGRAAGDEGILPLRRSAGSAVQLRASVDLRLDESEVTFALHEQQNRERWECMSPT